MLCQRSAFENPMHQSGPQKQLVSESGLAFWLQTTAGVHFCMMREVGWNQSAKDLCSFPESHLYHKEPVKTPGISKSHALRKS